MGISRWLLAALLISFAAGAGQGAASAQTRSMPSRDNVRVIIEVKDQSGAFVPGALIQYQQVSGRSPHETHADVEGRAILQLVPGIYNFVETGKGFRKFEGYFEAGRRDQVVTAVLRVGGCPPGPCVVVGRPGSMRKPILPASRHTTLVTIVVRDASGASIPNAKIEYHQMSEMSPSRTHAGTKGKAVLQLEPGIYTVVVTKAGFRGLEAHFEAQGRRQVFNAVLKAGTGVYADPWPLAAKGSGPPFTLNISTRQKVFESGHEVRVFIKAAILRATSWAWDRNDTYVAEDYAIDVRDAEGKEPPQSRYLKSIRGMDGSLPHRITVCAGCRPVGGIARRGEIHQNSLNLSALYDLSKTGRYTVRVSRREGYNHWVKSNTLHFTVAPRKTPPAFPAAAEGSHVHSPISLTIWPGLTDPFALDVITKNISDHIIVLKGEGFSKRRNWLPVISKSGNSHNGDGSRTGATGIRYLIQGDALASVYRIDVRDATGDTPAETDVGKADDIGGAAPPDFSRMPDASVSLRPGQEWHDTMHAGAFYDMRVDGDYTIRVRRWDTEANAWAVSNALTGTITNGYPQLQWLFNRGRQLINAHRYAEAASEYEKAAPLPKNKEQSYTVEYCLGYAYQHIHQYEKAVEHYQKAVSFKPQGGWLRMKLAAAYADENDMIKAAAEYKKAAKIDPGSAAVAYTWLGNLYQNNSRPVAAVAAYKKAAELNPIFASYLAVLGRQLMSKVTFRADGKAVAPAGTIGALETYLKLAPKGKYAQEMQRDLQIIRQGRPKSANRN
jgi:Tetratricopeptide repeat